MHNLDGPNMDPSQIVNIDPTDFQIPVSHANEPDCEVLAYRKEFLTEQFPFNFKREKLITMLEYSYSWWKNCNMKYAEYPQNLLYF